MSTLNKYQPQNRRKTDRYISTKQIEEVGFQKLAGFSQECHIDIKDEVHK